MEGGTLQVRSSVIRFKSGWKIELLTFHPSLHEQFLNSFGSPPLRNIEWNCVSVSEIVRSSLRRLYFVPRDYEFEKSESDSKFAKRSPRIYSSTRRAIFFITLFVMNYKVASLEIIRGSRDPVFFFYLSYPFNFEQEDEMVVRVKGSKLFRVVGEFF